MGLACIKDIRDRYDGLKRSPFDEAECGHHYARAMTSWGAALALTGFQYSGISKSMAFKMQTGTYFWSNGYAYGQVDITKSSKGYLAKLTVINGELPIEKFVLGKMTKTFAAGHILKEGQVLNIIL